ncbi:MAG: YraN family protein [Planctomycetota bacterium]
MIVSTLRRLLRRGRRRPLGPAGERSAATYLRRRGYRVLARNVRSRVGELDLVCLAPDRRTIVFVEVKSRRLDPNRPHPPPHASVTGAKRRKLVTLAKLESRRRGWNARPKRIDVVAVEFPSGRGKPRIQHFKDAVRG